MYCEKCNEQNDAMSVRCLNCGNTLIHSASTTKPKDTKDFRHTLFQVGGILIPLGIFEYFASDLFEPTFDSINSFRLFCAVTIGGLGAFLGKKLGDYVLGRDSI